MHKASVAMNARTKEGEAERALFTMRTGTVHLWINGDHACTGADSRRATINADQRRSRSFTDRWECAPLARAVESVR